MGLNTALRGVLAHQNALDVTGHNIANISTQGYTRQRAEMVTAPAWSNSSALSATTPGQMGTGVEVLRIERLRDQFIDANVRQQFGRQANSQALVEQLAQVEAAFGEPGDTGLNALMNNYFSAMDAVAANPQSTSARQAFIAAGNALAQGFNQVSSDLQAISAQSDQRLNQTVTEINGITTRISALNAEIRNAIEHNHQPNDLLDERDRLMDDLSKLVNYSSTENAFGEVTITFGTTAPIVLVDPLAGASAITRAQLDNAYTVGDLTSGRAFADETMWDPITGTINGGAGFLTRLDNLAAELVGDMNAAHAAGFDLAGVAGAPLFAGGTAATISFVLTNPNAVAAASSWAAPGEPGNGGNFARILDDTTAGNPARNATQAALGGQTLENYYSTIITAVGSRAETAARDMANADVLVEMAQGRRDQVSGVSMDEEMSNMLRFQHAYNASARVMTAMDEALDMIINRMGRVGL
jgi:flagellar hook-associated protein 1 FlgK